MGSSLIVWLGASCCQLFFAFTFSGVPNTSWEGVTFYPYSHIFWLRISLLCLRLFVCWLLVTTCQSLLKSQYYHIIYLCPSFGINNFLHHYFVNYSNSSVFLIHSLLFLNGCHNSRISSHFSQWNKIAPIIEFCVCSLYIKRLFASYLKLSHPWIRPPYW